VVFFFFIKACDGKAPQKLTALSETRIILKGTGADESSLGIACVYLPKVCSLILGGEQKSKAPAFVSTHAHIPIIRHGY